MKVDIIQTSFASGEFGPQLFGRTDIAQWANACETVENMLPRSYGPAISMPGTRYVSTVSDSTLRTRLIKFVFSRSDAYAIEVGDMYMRFYTNRGQVITPSGTEDLTTYGSDVKAHWKCNDNTNSTTVIDTQGSHNGTVATITQSLTTTAIVSTGFDLDGRYHVSVADSGDFTRTASSQPMTIVGWAYYANNGSSQSLFSKAGEYELLVNSSDQLSFKVVTSNADTKLLLHCDGSNGGTTFTDSSDSTHTMTANGNANTATDQVKFGTAAAKFDGSGDSISSADSADWDFGTGDFTIDFWVRFNSVSSDASFIDRNNAVDYQLVYSQSGGQLRWFAGNSLIKGETWSPSVDTWYHVAITRSGTNLDFWINGTKLGTTTTNSTNLSYTGALYIGSNSSGGQSLNGWMDEIRIVNGRAVWTSNFTVPAEPYVASVTNTWSVSDTIAQGWHLFAFVFKGDGTSASDLKIYVDGAPSTLQFSGDPSFVRMSDTSSLFRIGASSETGENNWKEKIDNIAFIHLELTAAQIASLYSTSVYQISTVFKENEVFDIHYTQLNDVVWLSHPNHPPQKLVRTSANEWTISDAPIIGGPFLDTNTDTSTSLWPSAVTGTINLTAATGKIVFTPSGSSLGHHGAYFMVGGLALTNSTTGLQETGYVQITYVKNSYTATATVIKTLKAATATTNWAEGAWSAVRGYPARVTFQERRLWFARTDYQPEHEWGSRVFNFEDFALDTQADDDALNLHLASNEANDIKWMISGKSLIAGTYGGAFITNSGSSEPITPDNATASQEIGIGSEAIMPKKVGSFIYYVQRFGKKIRELFYNWELDNYKSVDRTILSPHILGDGVVDMDVQHTPETILYCVLTSGTLATLTREVDQDVTAWARHTTAGTYASVAIIPSQVANYDEAWVIVERYINGSKRQYVEYFEDIEPPARQDKCLYLHSALSYDAYEATQEDSVSISLSTSAGTITVTSSTTYFTGSMINKRLRAIDASGSTLGEGVITATASTTSMTVSVTTTFNALSYSAGYWGVSVSSISGLSHLEAKTVGILADGQTESLTRTVSSGVVALGSNYFVVSIGLSYDQSLFTLPKEAGSARGTAQGKLQRISNVAFKVNRSTQNFQYGPNAEDLDNVNMAFTPTVTSLYTGVLPPQGGGIAMRGGYTRGAQVYIKNSQPLPLEVLSIMGELDTNDR